MTGSSSDDFIVDAVDCASFPVAGSDYVASNNYASWLAEKRKANGQERTHRCRACQAELLSAQESRVVRNTDQEPKFMSTGPK